MTAGIISDISMYTSFSIVSIGNIQRYFYVHVLFDRFDREHSKKTISLSICVSSSNSEKRAEVFVYKHCNWINSVRNKTPFELQVAPESVLTVY